MTLRKQGGIRGILSSPSQHGTSFPGFFLTPIKVLAREIVLSEGKCIAGVKPVGCFRRDLFVQQEKAQFPSASYPLSSIVAEFRVDNNYVNLGLAAVFECHELGV